MLCHWTPTPKAVRDSWPILPSLAAILDDESVIETFSLNTMKNFYLLPSPDILARRSVRFTFCHSDKTHPNISMFFQIDMESPYPLSQHRS